MSKTPSDYAPEPADMHKSTENIQILFTLREAAVLGALLTNELQRYGCAADPAVTALLCKIINAIWDRVPYGDENG